MCSGALVPRVVVFVQMGSPEGQKASQLGGRRQVAAGLRSLVWSCRVNAEASPRPGWMDVFQLPKLHISGL